MKRLIKNSVIFSLALSVLSVGCRDKENNSPTPTPNPSEQYINIPDGNLLKVLADAGVDTNKDGKISVSEVNTAVPKLTRLDAQNKNIRNMIGIEHFVNLTYLDISNNQITSFDASKLTKLQTLIAIGNQLSGTLDLSNSVNLKTSSQIVKDGNNTNLTAIKVVSSNTARDLNNIEKTDKYAGNGGTNIAFKDTRLKTCLVANVDLNIDRNGEITIQEAENFTGKITCDQSITTLEDLVYFKNIIGINLNNASLTSATISGFSKLKTIEMARLLRSISLSNLPALEELNLNRNEFTSLTLTGLPALKKLTLSNNKELTSLNINGLTSLTAFEMLNVEKLTGTLDISGLSKLIIDNVNIMGGGTNPQITSIKVATPTLASLLNAKEGTYVYTDGTAVSSPTITIPDTRLKYLINIALGRSRESAQPITQADAEKVTSIGTLTGVANLTGLENFKNLVSLNLSGSSITTADLTPFTKLTSLTLGASLTNVTVGSKPQLTSVTIQSSKFSKIDLSGCTALTAITLSGSNLINTLQCIRVATSTMVTKFRTETAVNDAGVVKYYNFTTNLCN